LVENNNSSANMSISGRKQKMGPSRSYVRLLEGEINSKEYTDQIKKSVKRRVGKDTATNRELASST